MNTDGKSSRVQRYWSGKAPQFANKGGESSGEEDEGIVFRKPQAARPQATSMKLSLQPNITNVAEESPRQQPVTTMPVDRRLQRLAVRNSGSEQEEEEDEMPAHRRHRRIYEGEIVVAAEAAASAQTKGAEEDDIETRRQRSLLKAKLLASQRVEEFPPADKEEVFQPPVPPQLDREQEEESSEYEESEGEEEEDEAPRILFKPKFVKKQERETIAERARLELEAQLAEEKRLAQLEQRRLESHNMVAEVVRKEVLGLDKDLAEKGMDNFQDIDDTDGQDPEGEYDAWKLRELLRIKRDKERREEWLREQEDIERRRLMTDEERRKDEMAAGIDRFHKEKKKQGFMQRYYHKGAFYQDQEILQKRDFTAPTVDDVRHKEALPSVMQVRGDWGKSGRTKWTHLANEDTTDKSAAWSQQTDLTKRTLAKMGGMKDDFDRPAAASKRHRQN